MTSKIVFRKNPNLVYKDIIAMSLQLLGGISNFDRQKSLMRNDQIVFSIKIKDGSHAVCLSINNRSLK